MEQREGGLSSCFLVFFFCSLFGALECLKNSQLLNRIKVLPGQPKVTFAQYSGYVTVHKRHGRALFYWLTEASNASATKPLVLWLNGGPGCSSLAFGASEEIGPFRINKTGSSLYLNKYAWNREANILFLESPAGVGFSYSNRSSDLKDSGDRRTAQDALKFLIRWFSRFPKYKHRDFYITGESYAGHYIPQLAKKILDYNNASSKSYINLKGILNPLVAQTHAGAIRSEVVGNGLMDNRLDSLGMVTYWWSHSMISDRSYRSILSLCNFALPEKSPTCRKAIYYAMNSEIGDIDPYNIYAPSCPASSAKIGQSLVLKMILLGPHVYSYEYDPCTENYAEVYYNRPDVQKAMHANSTGIPYRWTACSNVLIRNWQDSQFSMLPTYKELIAAGLRIWVFSGDVDSVVPVTATRFSISRLNLPVKTRWYPWYSGDQVGGWTEVYQGLSFATVRGAGHEVPLFQPKRAFHLFRAFLAGEELPKSQND